MDDSHILGLVFDCDGTLADSMRLHWRAWQVLIRRYGLNFSEERFYSLGGVPSRDILAMLKAEQGLELDPIKAAKEKEEEYFRLIHLVEPIEEVVSVVEANFGRRPMAVASGGTKRAITELLQRLDLLRYFQAVVTTEDVQRQKPAPDIFLEAARRIGVPPERCRAYEDTDLGLEAIRAAGMEAVDVRTLLAPGAGRG